MKLCARVLFCVSPGAVTSSEARAFREVNVSCEKIRLLSVGAMYVVQVSFSILQSLIEALFVRTSSHTSIM